jgi:hypothetical protein
LSNNNNKKTEDGKLLKDMLQAKLWQIAKYHEIY